MKKFILAACLLLMSCTNDGYSVTHDDQTELVFIKFVQDAGTVCNGLGLENARACSTWTDSGVCTIYIEEGDTWLTLKHELRHCFEGYWHETI